MFRDIAVFIEIFPYAIGVGMGIAIVCALLGVFVVLKRVVFISVALTQSAAAGIAAAFVLGAPPMFGAALFSLLVVTLLAYPYETRRVPRDAVLGAVFVFCSAFSILIVSKSAFGLTEVQALLYGDLIVASPRDFRIISLTLGAVFIGLLIFLRPILFTFLDRDQALVMGLRVRVWELVFFYLLGVVVSAASQAGGALLVFCYLTVPAMVSLLLANRIWTTMVLSVVVACTATLFGLYFAFATDLPGNQTIIMVHCLALALAGVARIAIPLGKRVRHRMDEYRNLHNP